MRVGVKVRVGVGVGVLNSDRQTRFRVAGAVGIPRQAILVVDLHKLDLGELLEVQPDQVGDVEVPAFGEAGAGQVDASNAIIHFQFAVAGKAVIDRDPTVGEAFGRAGTLEVFVQHGGVYRVRADVARSRHFNRGCVGVVTSTAGKIHLDQIVLRRDRRAAGRGGGAGRGDGRYARASGRARGCECPRRCAGICRCASGCWCTRIGRGWRRGGSARDRRCSGQGGSWCTGRRRGGGGGCRRRDSCRPGKVGVTSP
ncbi:MAG: hypothetical protein MZV64_17390 [Ignavibacteriales bacterium]|nr:hypothetical protein [Ignavibacteriales bacterium]